MVKNVFLLTGDEGKPNVEVIILVCTGAAATFLWLMLILFIRKLRKVKFKRPDLKTSLPLGSKYFVSTDYIEGSDSVTLQ